MENKMYILNINMIFSFERNDTSASIPVSSKTAGTGYGIEPMTRYLELYNRLIAA